MRGLYMGWLAVVACSSPSPPSASPLASDAAVNGCASPYPLTPIAVTGTTPSGSLDMFHYALAGYADCPDSGSPAGYLVQLLPSDSDASCAAPALWLRVFQPFATGTQPARAELTVTPTQLTDQVTFEAARLDPPDATPPHVVGRFISNASPWSFDIAIDLTSVYTAHCL